MHYINKEKRYSLHTYKDKAHITLFPDRSYNTGAISIPATLPLTLEDIVALGHELNQAYTDILLYRHTEPETNASILRRIADDLDKENK